MCKQGKLFPVLRNVSCCNFTGGEVGEIRTTQQTLAAAQLGGSDDHRHLFDAWVVPAVGRLKLTSSVTIAQVGETPHVPQPHAVSDAGEQELVLASPLLPL